MKAIKIFVAITLSAACVIGLLIFIFGVGTTRVAYTATVGVARANAEREAFKATKTYNESMAQDLAKYMLEYQTETDATAKKAIVAYIVHNYADFDADKLQNDTVKDFLNDCMKGELNG